MTKGPKFHLSSEQYQLLTALLTLIAALISVFHGGPGHVGILNDIHALYAWRNLLLALGKFSEASARVQHVNPRRPPPRSTNRRKPRRTGKPLTRR